MKKILIAILIAATTLVSANAQGRLLPSPQQWKPNPNAPKFKFTNGNTFDFGTIPEGPVAEHIFEFTNVGKEPLLINSVSTSAGHVSAIYPKEAILPGKKGTIKVTYTTLGRVAPFEKNIHITSNAVPTENQATYTINIKGTVVAKNY